MTRSLVRTFTDYDRNRGEEEAWELGRQLMLSLLLVLAVLCAIGWVFAPQIVRLHGGRLREGPADARRLQQARAHDPADPRDAAVPAGGGAGGRRHGHAERPRALRRLPAGLRRAQRRAWWWSGLALIPVVRACGQPAMLAMAIGVLVGGVLQFAYQLPPLYRLGFRLRWEWPRWHPGVRRVALLMIPATVSSAGWQINTVVNTLIASHLQQGSVSWLYYALRLQQLPVGVLGVVLRHGQHDEAGLRDGRVRPRALQGDAGVRPAAGDRRHAARGGLARSCSRSRSWRCSSSTAASAPATRSRRPGPW